MDRYNGLLPVAKESGLTSHDLIERLRRAVDQRKIGHTGTLDPLASGLLLICLGRATKLTQFLTDWDKSYRGEITLGATSDTLDSEGVISAGSPVPMLDENSIDVILNKFRGEINQKVPAYSAVKVNGKELHKYARTGKEVETPSRMVRIKSLTLNSFDSTHINIDVSCTKGTYIRTLADDIGREMGCGGYLSYLERLTLGPFDLKDALTLDEVAKKHQEGNLDSAIKTMEETVGFPVVRFREEALAKIKNGGFPPVEDIIENDSFAPNQIIGVADGRGLFLAIGETLCGSAEMIAESNRNFFKYVRVIN